MSKLQLLVILIAIMTCSCGSNPTSNSGPDKYNNTKHGSAKMLVRDSKSAEPEKSYGVIKRYRVTISGPGIEEPIVKEFAGDTETEIIEDIPAGDNRLVEVEAINLNDRLIREGESAGVIVLPGQISEAEVEMDAVPIFVNLDDGSVVTSTRLRFELFADPEDPLEVKDLVGDSSDVLFDVTTKTDEIYPDIASGLAVMSPGSVSVGDHTFEVKSRRSGKSSSVNVKVIDGSKVRPAPFFSGGAVSISGEYVGVARAGSIMHAGAGSGVVWPNFLGAVLTEY